MANGANDIANSVGTSYGAGALTLRHAIVLGSLAEFTGAMSLGSFVAQSIAKGVIDPASFAAEGCQGSLEYGLGMLAVLAGTGSTTLLATLYGLPISASHGVIGGLIAVGIFTHGVASLGQAPLVATLVAWVASPLLGGLTSGIIHAAVRSAVHEARSPAAAAYRWQPLLVALTITVAAAFLVVAGPAILRITPAYVGFGASCALGAVAALGTIGVRALTGTSQGLGGSGDRSGTHGRNDKRLKSATADGETVAAPSGEVDSAQPMEEQPFVPLLVLSALTVAFAHGANDLGNSIGPLAAILVLEQPGGGDITAPPGIPLWLLSLGAIGFVVGIVLLGRRTIQTVGGKITKLTPSRSFAVQMGTAVAVLSSTVLGLAVSTSHCLVGSMIGIGLADKLRGGADAQLNLGMILKIVLGWGLTIPLAMGVSVLALAALRPSYEADPLCDALAPPR